ncbi:MAG: hypothetical protein QOI61_2022 [Actinomycetota bacterium]|jgi:hypothetical protein
MGVVTAPLPEPDVAYLEERGYRYDAVVEDGMTCVVVHDWALPSGYDRASADLLIRLSPGYPDMQPDMWWFDPPVSFPDGSAPPATDARQPCIGRTWQRWSRHFNGGQWRSGIDGLESFFALIRSDLVRGAPAPTT